MKMLRIALLSLTLGLYAGVLFASVNQGVEEFDQRKYDAAYRSLYAESEGGNSAAMYYIGRMFLEGLGSVPKDSVKGAQLISRSAEKGNVTALKYLAQTSERNANYKAALGYYERLRKSDAGAEAKVEELNERLFSKERDLTKSYCGSLESLKQGGRPYNEARYANCVAEGKLANKTINDAIELWNTLAYKGDDDAAIKVIPYLVASRDDGKFDPVRADQYSLRLLESGKAWNEVKALLAKADITYSMCQYSRAGTNAQANTQRMAICRLSAMKGDPKAAKFVADRHLTGTDGFQSDLNKARLFIESMPDGDDKTQGQVYVLQRLDQPQDHLTKLLASRVSLPQANLKEGLLYQINSHLRKFNTTMPTELPRLEPMESLIAELSDCEVNKRSNELLSLYESNFKEAVAENRQLFDSFLKSEECKVPAIAMPNRSLVALPVTAKPAAVTPGVAAVERAVVAPIAKADVGEISTNQNSFPKNLNGCDARESNGCLEAARQILSGQAMVEIVDKNARQKLALDLLDKAVTLDSVDAMLMQYDILDSYKLPSPAETQKLGLLLDRFTKLNGDSGNLRIAHNRLTTVDPFKVIFGSLSGEMTNACNKVRLIQAKGNLMPQDRFIADSALSSPHCKR